MAKNDIHTSFDVSNGELTHTVETGKDGNGSITYDKWSVSKSHLDCMKAHPDISKGINSLSAGDRAAFEDARRQGIEDRKNGR